jgi:alkanesulfonate monooxygenase SsuD/methylene tetrahydromethanopterin reductase-like flavin-dependent oxidoreductase (luciferase family)
MHFGLFSLMAQRDRSVSPRQLYQEMVEQVKMAEQIGFDIAWFAEHHFSNYCLCPSPLAMAIALAPQTTKIRLGTQRSWRHCTILCACWKKSACWT